MWNYVAILAAGMVSMILGMIWFGRLFGAAWLKELGRKMPTGRKMPNMTKQYIAAFIGALITATFFDWILSKIATSSWMYTWQIAIYVWIGIAAVGMLGSVLWEGKSTKYYAITAGYALVNFLLVSSIIHYLGA